MSRSPNILVLSISLALIALVVGIKTQDQPRPRPWVSLAKLVPSIEKQCLIASFMEELGLNYQFRRGENELFVSSQNLRLLRSELRNQDLNYLIDPRLARHSYGSDLDYIVAREEQRLGQKLSNVLRETTQRRIIVWVKLNVGKVEFEEAHFRESSIWDEGLCYGRVFTPRHLKKFEVAKLQVFISIDEECGEDREAILAACRRAVGVRESRDSFKFIARPWSKELHAFYWESQE